MPREWHELRWSRKEMEHQKRVAMRKLYEAHAACDAAIQIELEYWHQVLARKFPKLRDRFRCVWVDFEQEYFIGTVDFADEPAAECVIRAPEKGQFGRTQHAAKIRVWHRRADGKKFRRDCVEYRCDEIIPFIRDVQVFEVPRFTAGKTEKQNENEIVTAAEKETENPAVETANDN